MEKKEAVGLHKKSSDLNPDNVSSVSISSKKKDTLEKKNETSKKNPKDFLYDKKIKCPVCGKESYVKAVKSSSVRVISRDTDFMIYYHDPNPMFYDVWLCIHCGYAALSNRFSEISGKQIKLIQENISARWQSNRNYPSLYTVDIAIEMYRIALYNVIVKEGKSSEKAAICLRLAWLYRLKKEEENEIKFLNHTREELVKAYESEDFPIMGLDESGVQYLIGEMYRRIGDNSNALVWFSKVLMNRNAKPKIKEMARDQKDLIQKERKE